MKSQRNTQPTILFEDDHLLAINKPSGLLSLPDRFNATLPNVRTMMKERYGEIFIVHRLDRDTSGVMILAKTAEAHQHLSEQFEHHRADKRYHAIVKGIVERDSFSVTIPIAADPRRKGLMKPTAKGKEAHTDMTVVERFRMATLLECRLITGRTHQIRVHCSAIGHPLLVDPDYGSAESFLLSTIKRKFNLAKGAEERPVIDRLTLHSFQLVVTHPVTNESLTIQAPYPRDFAATVQVLRKYAAPYTSTWDTWGNVLSLLP